MRTAAKGKDVLDPEFPAFLWTREDQQRGVCVWRTPTHCQRLIQQLSPHIRTRQMQHDLYPFPPSILPHKPHNLPRQLQTLDRRRPAGAPGDADPDGRPEGIRDEPVDPIEEVCQPLGRARGEEFECVEGAGRAGGDEGSEFCHGVGLGIWMGRVTTRILSTEESEQVCYQVTLPDRASERSFVRASSRSGRARPSQRTERRLASRYNITRRHTRARASRMESRQHQSHHC